MVNVKAARQAGGGVAILDAQLAAGAVAIGIHRGLGHAQFAGDLLGRQVLIDEPQTFALARSQQVHVIVVDVIAGAHQATSKRRLLPRVYFKA